MSNTIRRSILLGLVPEYAAAVYITRLSGDSSAVNMLHYGLRISNHFDFDTHLPRYQLRLIISHFSAGRL